jgi:hypothetical protein
MAQLTAEELAKIDRLNGILFPYADRKRKEVIARKGRFVHYTSAENALNIIRHRCLWMRNTVCMSDYREVHHGYDALRRYFGDSANRDTFAAALNGCSPGIAEEAIAQFDQAVTANQLLTYIASISEHDDREDTHGRLSMWRAFGNSTARVAMVIKLDLALGKNTTLGAELSPVAYFTDQEFAHHLNGVIANIRDNQQFLQSIGRPWLLATVQIMLTSAMVCLKHEGFHEEREWRLVHAPARHTDKHLRPSIESVAGVPQRIFRLPLKSDAEAGLTGLDPNELLDRIIIGPTQYPFAMYEAFVSALTDAGVVDAGKRIVISQIPVRT